MPRLDLHAHVVPDGYVDLLGLARLAPAERAAVDRGNAAPLVPRPVAAHGGGEG